jgi:iron complex outermembrane receptor protein
MPGSISVLRSDNLNLADATNLAATLNTLPGITMQTGTFLTNRIVIRGMGSRTPYNTNRIRSYLNEIPLTTADGVSTPEEIDLNSLEKIEVIKGPSSALYGSGLGGSINMYTPENTGNEAKLGVQYGSFNTLKTQLSGTINSGKARLWGSLSHLSSDGYRENNGYRRTSLLSTARWMQPNWSVNATFLFMDVRGGIPSSLGKTMFEKNPESAAPAWKAISGFKEYFKGLSAIALTNKITTRLTSNITLFGKFNDNYERRPFNNLDDQSMSGGIRGKISYRTKKSEFTGGAEYIAEQYKWKLDKDSSLLNENSENRRHLNVFGIMYFKPVPQLNISLAGALNHVSYRLTDLYPDNGDQSGSREFPLIVSPRLGINYAPGDIIAVYGSVGHGFSLPSPEETLLPAGDVNPDIKPEQGMQYEIGARLSLADNRIAIDAALYWIELKDLLVTKRITEDIFTGINAGKSRHQGFELLFQTKVFDFGGFPGRLMADISYTGSINRFIDFTDGGNTYDGNILPGIPRHSVALQLKWSAVQMLELSTHFQYTGDQYLNDSNSLDYPGYFLSNIKLTAKFLQDKRVPLHFYAGINNLTNTQYASMLIVNAIGFNNVEPRYYYPGLPRHFYGGMQLHF